MLGDVALRNKANGMNTASSVNMLTLANSMVITKDFGLYLSSSYLFLLHNLSLLCPLLSLIMVTQTLCTYQLRMKYSVIHLQVNMSSYQLIFTLNKIIASSITGESKTLERTYRSIYNPQNQSCVPIKVIKIHCT